MSDKDGILVSFTAPPVKHGLDESVQRRFSIVRTQDGSEEGVEVHSRELPMEFDGDDFHLVDRGSEEHPLLANVSYTYSVVSYYYFSDSNAYNAQDEDEAAQSNSAHIFSVPVNVQASIQANEEAENSFTETVTFDFPFGIEEGDKVVLERRETTFASGDPEWVDVEDSTFKTSETDKSKVTVTSTLTTGTSGNHDYWWNGITKLRRAAPDDTFYFLQNDCVRFENVVICGSRGWTCPGSADYTEHDEKLYLREAERFKLCFKEVEKIKREGDTLIALIHYPPMGLRLQPTLFTQLFESNGVDKVVFGHLHGDVFFPFRHVREGIEYILTSCDKVNFCLQRIL